MKLKKPLKGVGDVRRGPTPLDPTNPFGLPAEVRVQMNPIEREAWATYEARALSYEQKKQDAKTSPIAANRVGMGYTGPEMPDKGKKDGSCNRTACQMPLKGEPQFWMKDHMTGGRQYYCRNCRRLFDEADHQFREPLRCTADEDNEKLREHA